jgi:hypothetical protein
MKRVFMHTIKLAAVGVVVAGLVTLTESSSYGQAPSQARLAGGSVESMHGGAYRGSGGPSTRFVKEHGGYDPGKRPKGDLRAGVETAVRSTPISMSIGHVTHSCSFISRQRTGGISEMASCGKSGVRGNREQFVRAITRHIENRYFLSQLPH